MTNQGHFEIASPTEKTIQMNWSGSRFIWWTINHDEIRFDGESRSLTLLKRATPSLLLRYEQIEKISFELLPRDGEYISGCLRIYLSGDRVEKILFRSKSLTDAAAYVRLLLQISKTSKTASRQEIFRESQEVCEWGFYRLEKSERSMTLSISRSEADAIPVPLDDSEAVEKEAIAAHWKLIPPVAQGFTGIHSWSLSRKNVLGTWLCIVFALYLFKMPTLGTLILLALYLMAAANQGQFLSRLGIIQAARDLCAIYTVASFINVVVLLGMYGFLWQVLPYFLGGMLIPGLLHLGALFVFWRKSFLQLPLLQRDRVGTWLSGVTVVITMAALLQQISLLAL